MRKNGGEKKLLRKYRRTAETRGRRGPAFDPERAALLVVDMQDYFLDPESHARVAGAKRLLRNVAALAEGFRGKGRPVILTRHLNTRTDAGLLGKWWSETITETNPLSRIAAGLSRLPGADVVRKTQYDAFHRTPLERMLRARRISQLVIAGVATHLCVETTARSAFVKGFLVFLPTDATASFDRRHHQASLLNLSHGFAAPMLTSEIMERLGGAGRARR